MTRHIRQHAAAAGYQRLTTISESSVFNILSKSNIKPYRVQYYCERLGTVSLLAGIDLQTGEAIPLVSDTHNSRDYIAFLENLNAKYPREDKIRLILDNLKVHSSADVQKYISTVPDRFEFVFTPKHASWLNLVEGFFRK